MRTFSSLVTAIAFVATARADVKGTVRFKGKPPPAELLDRSSEAACAATPAYSQEIVLGKGNGLEGVHVRVKNGTAGKNHKPPAPATIRQKDCTYVPRVLGLMAGQELVIENQDGFMHNIHARIDKESYFNRSQPKGAPPLRQKDLGAAGQVLELGCDVHSWMKAYLPLTDHPFFAVTDRDGRFTIAGTPPGKTITLEAWHPVLGLKTIEVKPGATVEFVFP